MKKPFGTILLALGLLLGFGTFASRASTVVNFGTLDAAHDQLTYDGQLSTSGTADYRYNFSLGVGSSHTPVTLSAASANAVSLDNITIGLFQNDGTSLVSKFYSKATTPGVYTGGSIAGTLLDFSGILAAGNYYLQLIVASGKPHELFNGSIAISAVPLPAALYLFAVALVPLAATGMRRRRRDLAAAQSGA